MSQSQADPARVAALLPVYNESRHLPDLISRLKAQKLHILVVDDGSSDGSADIVQSYDVDVLRLDKNSGKGKALKAGFERLAKGSFDWILILDADGQHLPEEIPNFLKEAGMTEAAVFNGNRLEHPDRMPWIRYWTNCFMSSILSRMLRQEVRDSQCGYKLISTEFLRKARLSAEQFEIEANLLLEAGRLQYKIKNVPITSVYGKEVSHIHPVRDTFRFIRFLWMWNQQYRGTIPS